MNFLEHVQAHITLTSARRGDIQLFLTSPGGTKSTLLAKRPHDSSRAGFHDWPFLTVFCWGEQPAGTWELEIQNDGRYQVTLSSWSMTFHGTETNPDASQPVPSPSPAPPSPPPPPKKAPVPVSLPTPAPAVPRAPSPAPYKAANTLPNCAEVPCSY